MGHGQGVAGQQAARAKPSWARNSCLAGLHALTGHIERLAGPLASAGWLLRHVPAGPAPAVAASTAGGCALVPTSGRGSADLGLDDHQRPLPQTERGRRWTPGLRRHPPRRQSLPATDTCQRGQFGWRITHLDPALSVAAMNSPSGASKRGRTGRVHKRDLLEVGKASG